MFLTYISLTGNKDTDCFILFPSFFQLFWGEKVSDSKSFPIFTESSPLTDDLLLHESSGGDYMVGWTLRKTTTWWFWTTLRQVTSRPFRTTVCLTPRQSFTIPRQPWRREGDECNSSWNTILTHGDPQDVWLRRFRISSVYSQDNGRTTNRKRRSTLQKYGGRRVDIL